MIELTQYSVSTALINQALSTIVDDNFKQVLNQPTGNFFYDSWQIKEQFQGTCWQRILDSLPGPVGEARIITLEPGTNYYSHADIDDRWHLSLQGNQSYLIDLETHAMFETIQDGHWYLMNAGKLHTAANFGQLPRRQLVVRKLLVKNVLVDPIEIRLTKRNDTYDYRYQFDHHVSPWLNMANKQGLIADFSYTPEQVTLKIEKLVLDNLLTVLGDYFKAETI